MPLTPTTPETICDRDAFCFVMLDGDSFVRVDVHRSLLERITFRRSESAHLAAFEEHRGAIERIASAKYDRGDYRSFANSRVVPIGPDDLHGLADSETALTPADGEPPVPPRSP